MTTLNRKRLPSWMLWLLWFGANLAGWLLYAIPVGFVQLALGLDRLDDPQRSGEITVWFMVLAAILCGAAIGVTIGLAQWLVLRRAIERIGGWVTSTMVGYASIGFLPLIADWFQPGWSKWAFTLIINGKMHWLARVEPEWNSASWLAGAITLTLFGAVLGVMQWLSLRRRVQQAGWWIAISTGAWALAVVLSRVPFWVIFASWLAPILVTGTGMAWLLRHSVPIVATSK